ncbi:DUF3918 domain-containing protein [Bacillus spongiae]|uniref:DUF3918 domain-containing protein n=1 Tax=Bacillus spongiae TaxID=2683610 RepID=A0ABU8H8W6_9BACI
MNRRLSTLLGFGAGVAASLGGRNQKQWKRMRKRMKKVFK